MADTVSYEETIPPAYAAQALEISVKEWSCIGIDFDDKYDDLEGDELHNSLVERLTSILLVRAVAVIAPDRSCFPDLSISSICRTVLMQENPWSFYAPGVTQVFIDQLREFVNKILSGYHLTPYHCSEHAFHVVCSVNKLLDMLLQTDPDVTKTFGIRHDPLSHFALTFGALIHDVEHKGVPNRQLVVENDPLAVLYNDESVAEQRSLFIGFDQLLCPEFAEFRETLFGGAEDGVGEDTYRRFRKLVIGLVLSTDIASPERTQLGKSKWKEAFGETFESIERKLKRELCQMAPNGSMPTDDDDDSFYNDDSVSETPDSSVNEDGDTMSQGTVSSNLQQLLATPISGTADDSSVVSFMSYNKFKPEHSKPQGGPRRGSVLSMPSRRGSTQLLQSDDAFKAKFQRRMSSMSNQGESMHGGSRRPSNFRKRLGIRRSMDLGGEALEMYRRETAVDTKNMDEPDELRAHVVLETILTAADVAHNLQGWQQMLIWSGRLYLELRKAFVEGRGADPRNRWFENQIGFLESYLLPLAHRLEDTGVFGDVNGPMFATIIEQNRDRWVSQGQVVADAIIVEGDEIFDPEDYAEERAAIAAQTRQTGKGFGLKFRGTNLVILAAGLLAVMVPVFLDDST